MKAILVLDEMPKCCFECPLRNLNYENDYHLTCILDNDMPVDDYTKPRCCPLKELPEERNTVSFMDLGEEAEQNGISTQRQAGYNSGWNACLKEITEGIQ